MFSQLQQTVGGKAEWMDLNDNIIELNKAKEVIDNHQHLLDGLEHGFTSFQACTNETGKKVDEQCNNFRTTFKNIESRFKLNEEKSADNHRKANLDVK